jgi:hypothetical protein
MQLTLFRNGVKLYEQIFQPEEASYTRQANDRIVLAANMGAPQQASLGDIDVSNPGQHLLVTADRQIKIGVNSSSVLTDAEALMVIGGSVETLYFQNTDATNTATVEFVVTD